MVIGRPSECAASCMKYQLRQLRGLGVLVGGAIKMLIHMEVSDREAILDNKARHGEVTRPIPKRRRRATPIKNLHHENVKHSLRAVGGGLSFVALSADYPHQVYHTHTRTHAHTLKLIAHKCAIHNAQQAGRSWWYGEGVVCEEGDCQLADANRV